MDRWNARNATLMESMPGYHKTASLAMLKTMFTPGSSVKIAQAATLQRVGSHPPLTIL
jgi:hypothetical protein